MRVQLHLPARLEGRVWRYQNPGLKNRRHRHAELELNLVTRGLGTYLLGNRRYQIRRGDLLWLFPAQEHVLMEQSADFEMWIAVFKHRAIKRVTTDPSAKILQEQGPVEECCRRLAHTELARLEELFVDLVGAEEQRPGLLNAGLSYALLSAWRCFEGAADVPVRDVHPAVERAARLIQEGETTLKLEELAQHAGLSPARLSRLFKEQTGFAMVDFRNRQRVERFLDLYGTGQRQTMLDAALEAGFGSYPQFHRVFRAVVGCSPGDYKRNEIS
jgi:AraC-like DNA-binding protein